MPEVSAFIDTIVPNPITVRSGSKTILTVTLTCLVESQDARLVIVNKQPLAAELIDIDETADVIRTDSMTLILGTNNFIVYEIGLILQDENARSGAIVGLELFVESTLGQVLSPSREILAVVGA